MEVTPEYDQKKLQRVVKTGQRSPVPHSPPSRPSRASDACVRRKKASSKTVLTSTTDCSPHSPLGGVTGLPAPKPAGSEEASSPAAVTLLNSSSASR
ncbi:hypothetical protein AALO_G00131540 [Alosa alosa]|uniref:Uncharacterized protein n=1 Tax=Alosa alosa TaxID=278164 RepID=A0AAV6GRY0_9TELE|nr:hypothetical protein AALO_G00131540 [Alosa alosa]